MAPVPTPLNGALILLLGGVPDSLENLDEMSDANFRQLHDQMMRVQEAVISLSRAVFSAGGRLALQDDSFLTPLVAQIASEYWTSASIETPRKLDQGGDDEWQQVIVYQPQKALHHEENFKRPFNVRVVPEMPASAAAAVAIGGSEQQFEQISSWIRRREDTPLYVITSTGGLTEGIKTDHEPETNDERLWQTIQSMRKEIRFSASEELEREPLEENVPEFRSSIYPLLMSKIVEEVIRRRV